jgi:hypothetical protein
MRDSAGADRGPSLVTGFFQVPRLSGAQFIRRSEPVSDGTTPIDQPLIEELPGSTLRISRQRRERGAMRDHARIITMAWGDRYITDLLSTTLPALLAPGNLPAFAEHFRCELVIVTETRLFERIAASAVISAMLPYCDVRLVPIDDLLSNWYGITLTYALVRGFADLGAAMVDTHLVFLNADFIVADGSYRKLAEVIRRGERLVCSPSYCMVLEDTIDQLRARYDEGSCALTVSPREMAAMIIAHRHNTIRAKTVNQQLFRIHRYDQYYWYVNEGVMLCRQMPIAVVYMRPERVLSEMPTFWDYGVISEYCPTIKPCVLGDSDDFLMGELRTEGTFGELLHLGWPTVEEIAADLSSFTTRDHHEYGRFTLTLHSVDLPADIEASKAKLAAFVDAIYRRLAPPIDYRDHPFWVPGFPHFLQRHIAESDKLRRRERIKSEFLQEPEGRALRQKIERLVAEMYTLRTQQRSLAEAAAAERQALSARLRQAELDYARARETLEAEHRRRSAELQSEIDNLQAATRDELQRVHRAIDAAQRHFMDLAAEQRDAIERRALAAGAEVRETAPIEPPSRTAERTLWERALVRLSVAYNRFFGFIPHTSRWHPYHTMLRPVVTAILASRRNGDVLLISSGGPFGTRLLKLMKGRQLTVTPGMILTAAYKEILTEQTRFDVCVCDLDLEDLLAFRAMLEKIRPLLRPAAKIILFHHNGAERPLDAWVQPFAKRTFPLIGQSKISFAGSGLGAFVARWYSRAVMRFIPSRLGGMLALAAFLGAFGPLARLACNLETKRSPQVYPRHCTSMTVEIDLP